ncbi:MAG: DUF1294 domain-containing protein [Lachnospiraceae bacterium]|nr:DUF1294 domain-containing protein [Lachnospiraceae bacterium]
MTEHPALLIITAAISILTFFVFGIDKYKAVRHRWRIPEATLIGLCLIGGSAGGLLGMLVFRHKIRKPKFCIGVPLILAVQLIVLWL